MTHMTDQERAEFEHWYSSEGKQPEVLTKVGESTIYKDSYTGVAWAAWQAARRAQVAPMTLEQAQQSMRSATSHKPGKIIAASGLCAPQPPEANSAEFDRIKAAPVQMPEPAAYLHECGKKPSLRTLEFSKVDIQLAAKGYKSIPLYTEHQVRPLLAAQQFTLDELAMLTRKLVQQLRKASPGNESAEKALDYLKRKGLAGNPLRATKEPST